MDYSTFQTFYEVLGIADFSSIDECKDAYKKLCIKFHTDKIGDNPYFKFINKAHEVLCDPKKKEQYDKFIKTRKITQDIKQTVPFAKIASNAAVQTALRACRTTLGLCEAEISRIFDTFEQEVSKEIGGNVATSIKDIGKGFVESIFGKKKKK